MIDFSKLTLIPGAIVAVLPRPDKKGYRLEASIPLSLLPEITSIQVHFYSFFHNNNKYISHPKTFFPIFFNNDCFIIIHY